jgi:hypothetical protein
MKFRLGCKSCERVPAPDQALNEAWASLARQQKLRAERLAGDPAAFARLEPQIHLAFQRPADRRAASLLAHAAAQPGRADASKKR